MAERWASGALGGTLVYFGIRRRTIPGLIAAGLGAALLRRAYTGYCPTYAALGVDTAHRRRAEPHEFFEHGVHVEQAVTISKSPEELFTFWHRFENLPRFMRHLEAVRGIDEKRSHWVARGPAGKSVEWDAEIINEEPNLLIAWRSLEGADVDNAGSVRFVPRPRGRGTEVRVVIEYIPPAGMLGKVVAQLFGEEPSQQVKEDLRRFKQLMEA
jgi:uncharacterized membrane protein